MKTGKTFFASTRELQRQMIAEGIGVGYILAGATPFYVSDSSIVTLPILDDRFVVNMKVVFRKASHLSDEARKFKDFALKYLTES